MLELFKYQYNEAILHTDTSVLPDNKRAWASWNYRIPATENNHAAVSIQYEYATGH